MVRLCFIAYLVFWILCLNIFIYGKEELRESESDDVSESSSSSRSRSSSSSSYSSSSSSYQSDSRSKSFEESNPKRFMRSNANVQDFYTNHSDARDQPLNDYATMTPTWDTVNEVQKVTDKCIHCICEATGGCRRDRPTQTVVESGKSDIEHDSALGPLRITRPYWEDAGSPRVSGKDSSSFFDCVNDMSCAAKTVKAYMERYPFDCNGDGIVNCSDYAAIHNKGPFACHNNLPASYEERFLNCWNGPKEDNANKDASESWFTRFLRRTRTETPSPHSTISVITDTLLNQELPSTTAISTNNFDSITEQTELTTASTSEPIIETFYSEKPRATEEGTDTQYTFTTRQENTDISSTTVGIPTENNEISTFYGVNSEAYSKDAITEQNEEATTMVLEEYEVGSNSPPSFSFKEYTTEHSLTEQKMEKEFERSTEISTFKENITENLTKDQTFSDTTTTTEAVYKTDSTTALDIVTEPEMVAATPRDVLSVEYPYLNNPQENFTQQFSTLDSAVYDITEQAEYNINNTNGMEVNEATTTPYVKDYMEITNDIEPTQNRINSLQEEFLSSTVNNFYHKENSSNEIFNENENNDITFTTSKYFSTDKQKVDSQNSKKVTQATKKSNAPPQVMEITDDCIHCICEATSGCEVGIFSENSLHGPFRITKPYWKDAGKPKTNKHYGNSSFISCVNDLECAERTVRAYMKKYHFDCNGDGIVNCTDYAAIHNNGPYECKKPLPEDYLTRFLRCTAGMTEPSIDYELTTETQTEKQEIKNWFSNVLSNLGS